MAVKIQFRRDTATNWTNTNPVLAQGEIGLDLTNNFFKIGDGTSAWNSLNYWSEGSAYTQTEFTATASQTVFSVNYSGTVDVMRNGFSLSSTDFVASGGNTITLNTACAAGDLVIVRAWKSFSVANVVPTSGGTMTGNLSVPSLDVTGSGYMRLPSGTTAERPASPLAGMLRYNSSTLSIEGYNGSAWVTLSAAGSALAQSVEYATVDTDIRKVWTAGDSLASKITAQSVEPAYFQNFYVWFIENKELIDTNINTNIFNNVMKSSAVLKYLMTYQEGWVWVMDKWNTSTTHYTELAAIFNLSFFNGFTSTLSDTKIWQRTTPSSEPNDVFNLLDGVVISNYTPGDFITIDNITARVQGTDGYNTSITLTTNDDYKVPFTATATASSTTETTITTQLTEYTRDATIAGAVSGATMTATIDYANSNSMTHTHTVVYIIAQRPAISAYSVNPFLTPPSLTPATTVSDLEVHLNMLPSSVGSFAYRINNNETGNLTEYLTSFTTLLNTAGFVDNLTGVLLDNIYAAPSIARQFLTNSNVKTDFIHQFCYTTKFRAFVQAAIDGGYLTFITHNSVPPTTSRAEIDSSTAVGELVYLASITNTFDATYLINYAELSTTAKYSISTTVGSSVTYDFLTTPFIMLDDGVKYDKASELTGHSSVTTKYNIIDLA